MPPPPKKIAPQIGKKTARVKKGGGPTQVNPNGIMHKILGANGKIRWEFRPR